MIWAGRAGRLSLNGLNRSWVFEDGINKLGLGIGGIIRGSIPLPAPSQLPKPLRTSFIFVSMIESKEHGAVSGIISWTRMRRRKMQEVDFILLKGSVLGMGGKIECWHLWAPLWLERKRKKHMESFKREQTEEHQYQYQYQYGRA